MLTETIAAISTGGTSSGINIIRISGEKALEIVSKIFTNYAKLDHQKIIYGKIINNNTSTMVDEVLVSCFKAPHSFTGEDVCEINCHGGRKVTLEILKLVIDSGARIAEPGEFSKRAFLNGKMDLSKAEAIIDVINAKTSAQAKVAVNQLSGGIYDKVETVRDMLVTLMAEIEVSIDYPEYDYEEITIDKLTERLDLIKKEIDLLIKTHNDGKYIKNGINLAIVGNTNVGKSSLLNTLLNEEKAIVTDIEGTTRDVIEETLIIGNLVLNVSDTAGIRETDDVVEAIGVNKSLKAIDDTDMIIYLIDLSRGLNSRDIELLEKIKGQNKPYIIGLNKVDISREKIEDVKSQLGNHKNIIGISSKTGEGIVELKDTIEEIFNISNIDSEESRIIVNERHKDLLEKARNSVIKAKEIAEMGESLDVAAIDIKEATEMLGNITGKNASSDVVNKIFEKFCLGK